MTAPCFCTTLKRASRVLARLYDHELESSGINVTQLAVLRCIGRRLGQPLSRVAEELEMDRTSLYRAMAPLVRDGLLEVKAGIDGRSRSAIISARGSEVLSRAGEMWNETQGRLFSVFGGDAWAKLVVELKRLEVSAHQLGPI